MTAVDANRDETLPATIGYGRILSYLMACAALWVGARPYEGIIFDGQLYTLLAMAARNPYPLADDLFLKFGSQTDFTLFPHLVGALIGVLGIEPAVALVTVTSALLLLAAGWWFGRRLSSPKLAWLSLGLLIAVPGWYGRAEIFRFDEMYLSARVPAEAFSVIALIFACRNQWWRAALSLAVAVSLHPVMAAPAIGIAALLAIDNHSDRLLGERTAAVVALGGAVLVAVAAALFAPAGTPEHVLWIQSLHTRTVYAFLQNWRLEDWIQNALGLATLAVAATALGLRVARRIAHLGLLIGLIGLALAALASAGGRFDALLLPQSWRWPWLSRFIAVALLPAVLSALWKDGRAGRASALLLASAWVLSSYSGGIVAIAAAVLWLGRSWLEPQLGSVALRGAYLVAAAAVVVPVAFAIQAIPVDFDTNMGPLWVQRLRDVAGLTGPPMLAIAAVWYLAVNRGSSAAAWVGGAVAAIALAGLLQYDRTCRSEPVYSSINHARFASWRAAIPPSAEVLWHEDPGAVWLLLERKSFLSVSQSAGLMYSPAATPEFLRRSRSLSPLVDPRWWTLGKRQEGFQPPKPLSLPALREICQNPALGFVVSYNPLDGYRLRAEWPTQRQYVYLYDCSSFRPGTPL